MFVQGCHFEETPIQESTEIAYETQVNQMHDVKWYGSGYMYCVKEKTKGRDSLDAGLSGILGIVEACLAICFVALSCPMTEFQDIDFGNCIPLESDYWRTGRIVITGNLTLLTFLGFVVIDVWHAIKFACTTGMFRVVSAK